MVLTPAFSESVGGTFAKPVLALFCFAVSKGLGHFRSKGISGVKDSDAQRRVVDQWRNSSITADNGQCRQCL